MSASAFGGVGATIKLIVIELGAGAFAAISGKRSGYIEVSARLLVSEGEQPQAGFKEDVEGCALLAETGGDFERC